MKTTNAVRTEMVIMLTAACAVWGISRLIAGQFSPTMWIITAPIVAATTYGLMKRH